MAADVAQPAPSRWRTAGWPPSTAICDDGAVFSIGRLLTALVIACAGVVLTLAPAHAACPCATGDTLRDRAQQADVVFSGVVRGRERAGREQAYHLEIQRIYRGEVPDERLVVVAPRARSRCGIALRPGREYVVFAKESATELETDRCVGTDRATPAYLRKVEKLLGAGQPANEPASEPAPPDFERVDDTSPPTLARAVAPGAAMVLVGLLGLLLFRRRG